MARVEPKSPLRRDRERQPIEMVRGYTEITLRNPGTGEVVTLPIDASHATIARARRQLRPDEKTIYDANAKDVVDGKYGKEPPPAGDPEPIVTMTPGALQRKQQAAHDAWRNRKESAAARQRELRDRKELIEGIAEAVRAELPESSPAEAAPAPVDLGEIVRQRWEATAELNRLQRDPQTDPALLEAAQKRNAEIWNK